MSSRNAREPGATSATSRDALTAIGIASLAAAIYAFRARKTFAFKASFATCALTLGPACVMRASPERVDVERAIARVTSEDERAAIARSSANAFEALMKGRSRE